MLVMEPDGTITRPSSLCSRASSDWTGSIPDGKLLSAPSDGNFVPSALGRERLAIPAWLALLLTATALAPVGRRIVENA